jgi:hypothetical protein
VEVAAASPALLAALAATDMSRTIYNALVEVATGATQIMTIARLGVMRRSILDCSGGACPWAQNS